MKKNGKNHLPDKRYLLLKMILRIKFVFILLFMVSLQLSAKAFSQQVSIRMANVSFKEVVKEIEKQTGLAFLYSDVKVNHLNQFSFDTPSFFRCPAFFDLAFGEEADFYAILTISV